MAGERLSLLDNHRATLFRFVIVGGTTYGLTTFAFHLLNDIWNLRHSLSATAAYFIGVTYHFTMNRMFTFRDPHGSLLKHLAKYAILVAANYVVTLALFQILLRSMHTMSLIPFALSVAITTATGYLVMRFWIFRSGSVTNSIRVQAFHDRGRMGGLKEVRKRLPG